MRCWLVFLSAGCITVATVISDTNGFAGSILFTKGFAIIIVFAAALSSGISAVAHLVAAYLWPHQHLGLISKFKRDLLGNLRHFQNFVVHVLEIDCLI